VTPVRSVRLPLIFTLILVLLGSLGIGACANSLFFHRLLINSYDARLLAIALDARDVFTRAASLGLPLGQVQGGDAVLRDARNADPSLLKAIAYEAREAHFIALSGADTELPPAWARTLRRAPAADHWQITEPGGFGVLVPIRTPFGTPLGLIALVQSDRVLERPQQDFNAFLWRQAALVAVPILLGLAGLVAWILSPLERRIPVWIAHFDALLAGHSAALSPPDRKDPLDPLIRSALPHSGGATVEPTESRDLSGLQRRVTMVTIGAILLANLASALLVAQYQDQALAEALLGKPLTVSAVLKQTIVQAVDLGIPLDSLRGLDPMFRDTRAANPEITFLRLSDPTGRPLASDGTVPEAALARAQAEVGAGQATGPVRLGGQDLLILPLDPQQPSRLGTLSLGVSQDYTSRLIKDRLIDLATVGLVTLTLTLESLRLLLDRQLTGSLLTLQAWSDAVRRGNPTGTPPEHRATTGLTLLVQRAHQWSSRNAPPQAVRRPPPTPWPVGLRAIRMCLLLFVLADSLPLSLLPLYASELYEPLGGVSRDLLLSAPVVVYWLASALIQLPCSALLDRFSYRISFAIGATTSAAGGLIAAWASDLPTLLLARGLAGIGLGIVFSVGQAAIVALVPATRRATGLASFSGVFFLATFCGAALGGLLADELGLETVFLILAGVSVWSCVAAWAGFGATRDPARPPVPVGESPSPWQAYRDLARTPRFIGLILLAALPNRMFNLALVFFLVPLCLHDQGISKSDIARVVSAYGLIMALLVPISAGLADRLNQHVRFVLIGSLICATGGLMALVLPASWAMVVAVIGMGCGQAMQIPSQMTLVPTVAAAQAQSLGVPRIYALFRVSERVPAFFGPILAGAMASWMSYPTVVASWGGWLLLSTAGLWAVFQLTSRPEQNESRS